MLRAIVLAAAGIALLSPAGAHAGTKTSAVTPKQVCAAVQSATLATPVAALAKILPAKYQPSATLKTIVGPVAGASPLWAPTALKVGQVFVRKEAPRVAPTVSAPLTALMASRTMDITNGAASVFVSWFGSGVTSYQEQTYGDGQWEQPLSVATTTPYVWLRIRPRRLTRVSGYTRSQFTEGAVVVIEPVGTRTLKVPIDS